MVMAGKMFMGDPKVRSAFKQRTGVDLVDEEKKVMIVCSTPEFLRTEHSSLQHDIVDGMYRRFRLHDVDCINPNKVDTWLSSIGGVWDDMSEIAQEFETDYIIHIEIDEVKYREDNSPQFFRGNAHGMVSVYAARETPGGKGAFLVFQQEYQSTYPSHYPIAADHMSERAFGERFNKQIANELARIFYDYHANEGVD